MKRLSIALLCVLALTATAAWAQTDPATGSSTSMGPLSDAKGKVITTSATSLVIQTTDGTRVTLVLDTDIDKPADLKPGEMVVVEYHALTNGTNHATTVSRDSSATASASTELSGSASTQPATPSTYGTPASETPTSGTMADDNDADDDSTYSSTSTLPQTASPNGLVGLIGLLALAGAAGLHAAQRRS